MAITLVLYVYKNFTLGSVDCESRDMCIETNLIQCLSSVYSVTIPLHVLGLPVTHHQEAAMCM
jgi:hypothetical protein